MKPKKTNTNKGITLIALVITVIVLLILAGTAISIAVNGNNIFAKANTAVESYNAKANEQKIDIQRNIDILAWYSKEPGLYDSETLAQKYSWQELLDEGVLQVTSDTLERGANFSIDVLDGMLIIDNSVTTIGTGVFNECTGLKGHLVIPNSVTTIGNGAFYGCTGLTGDLVIPDTVITIGGGAFSQCAGLTSLKLGNSITSIGGSAFYNCTGLTGDILIPSSVTAIGGSSFYGCTGLTGKLTIPNSVTTLYSGNFTGTKFNDININMYNIPDGAFTNCSDWKGNLCLGSDVTTIGAGAFYMCTSLTSVTIPNTVESIGGGAFGSVAHIYYTGDATGSPWGANAIN